MRSWVQFEGERASMERRVTLHLCSLFQFLSLLLCSQPAAASRSAVNFLPGFHGPLPFHLETGYVGVGESEDVQLFYYFVRSEKDPKKDPLLLWLTGGPGCSGLSGLAFEIGPFNFKAEEYNGSLPCLVSNPNSWTKVSSVIFLDSPVGTGFSYARTPSAAHSGDRLSANQTDEFLRKWLEEHPKFFSNSVYLGGDSYSGITVPSTFKQMMEGNEAGMRPTLNLKGYLLGNPKTAPIIEKNSAIPFAYGMALISKELFESLRGNCKENYVNIDPQNTHCLESVKAYQECTDGINSAQILEPPCAFAFPKPFVLFERRSLKYEALLHSDNELPQFGCRTYSYVLCRYWINDKIVQDALHIQKGSIGEWKRCNDALPYTKDIPSSVPYHAYISTKGYRSLVYSGDHDMLIPYIGTEEWIKSLNYSIVEDWRPWKVDNQIGGYTRTYLNGMTFATVKGGGHTAPEYKPRECFTMFQRWISEKPL